jgi:hypothetical protein
VGSRGGLDDVEKRKFLNLPRLELRSLGHPARSQSLYRLRYPGLLGTKVDMFNYDKKDFKIHTQDSLTTYPDMLHILWYVFR